MADLIAGMPGGASIDGTAADSIQILSHARPHSLLLTNAALTTDYDHIIFDTAPTGHTIRLLRLRGAGSGFLEQGKGDASCLGPLAGLEKQHAQYKDAVEALADPRRTL